MALKPSTNLKILKVPLEIDYKNQLTFKNKTEQFNYFNNLECIEIDEISYQRHNSVISFPGHIDSILEYNYCMYQNENYGDKWFYAYITNMTYQADCCTEITIATDVFQTWQFDFMFKQSFVEREMINVNDDVPGANLLPEGLETGEYIVNNSSGIRELSPMNVIAYMGNPEEDGIIAKAESPSTTRGITTNGVPNGMYLWFGSNDMLEGMIYTINNKAKGNSIMAIFTVPTLAFVGWKGLTIDDLLINQVSQWIMLDHTAPEQLLQLVKRPDSIDNYQPSNKKLLTYPYLYLAFNNNNGGSKIYRYENFENGTPNFKMISEINPNPDVVLIPQNYKKKSGDNISESSHVSGYPTLGWITDYYNSWLAQNGPTMDLAFKQLDANYQQGLISNTAGILTNAITSGISAASQNTSASVSGIQSSVTSGFNRAFLEQNYQLNTQMLLEQKEKQELIPNTGNNKGSNTTLLGYGKLQNDIFTRYSIKHEYAKRIDKFFDVYGYLTNEFKIPNTNNRPNWNYVKLTQCNIIGNIPQQDLQELKLMFEKGITLWHNSSTFLDYSQNNR